MPPASCVDTATQGLPDVVNILGVTFERWKQNEDNNDDTEGISSPLPSSAADDNLESGQKMTLLYLPGIEGLGTSVEPQLPSLSAKFDVFRLIIGAEDRSTFSTLSRAVSIVITTAVVWRAST